MAQYSFKRLAFIALLSIVLSPSLAYAQLGEVAGQLTMNVSIGSSNSLPFTLVNGGTAPIDFRIVLPTMSSSSSNAVPAVVVRPMNGTIPPGSEMVLNVTVSLPSSQGIKPGTSWTGILQAVVAGNGSVIEGSGASIQEGVAKIVTVTAMQPGTSYVLYGIAVAVVAALAAAVLYIKKPRFGRRKFGR